MLIFDLMNENLDPTDSNFTNEEVEIDKALRRIKDETYGYCLWVVVADAHRIGPYWLVCVGVFFRISLFSTNV